MGYNHTHTTFHFLQMFSQDNPSTNSTKWIEMEDSESECGEPPTINNENARYNRNIGAHKRFN